MAGSQQSIASCAMCRIRALGSKWKAQCFCPSNSSWYLMARAWGATSPGNQDVSLECGLPKRLHHGTPTPQSPIIPCTDRSASLFHFSSHLPQVHISHPASLADEHRMPAMCGTRTFSGRGLMACVWTAPARSGPPLRHLASTGDKGGAESCGPVPQPTRLRAVRQSEAWRPCAFRVRR